MYCTNCGFRLEEGDSFCSHCGHKVGQKATSTENIFENVADSYHKIMAAPKSKLIAGILAIVLGSAGVHDFYLGYTSKGIAHLLMISIQNKKDRLIGCRHLIDFAGNLISIQITQVHKNIRFLL